MCNCDKSEIVDVARNILQILCSFDIDLAVIPKFVFLKNRYYNRDARRQTTMENKIATLISRRFVQHGIIAQAYEEVYLYGLELIADIALKAAK